VPARWWFPTPFCAVHAASGTIFHGLDQGVEVRADRDREVVEVVDAVPVGVESPVKRLIIGDERNAQGLRHGQRDEVRARIEELATEAEVVFGNERDFEVSGADAKKGAFFMPTLLQCERPLAASKVHSVEAFGPVSTVLPYENLDEALELARLGGGSLAGSIITNDNEVARELVLGSAAWHGRMLIINRHCAAESTGHGSPLPHLVHGGPGRAGGGEELGGIRGALHYMQRTAIQGSPETLAKIGNRWIRGGIENDPGVHPFRKTFEQLEIGEEALRLYKPRQRPFDIFISMKRAEWDTLMFFYGVILCVGGLGALGYLAVVSEHLYTGLGPTWANVLVGVLSAIVDNIPVMFAVLTMNPDMSLGQWLLVTLTAGVGGSLLSIGSAAGVALMGQARGVYTFFAHLKWSWAVALGYAASIWVHMTLNSHLHHIGVGG